MWVLQAFSRLRALVRLGQSLDFKASIGLHEDVAP